MRPIALLFVAIASLMMVVVPPADPDALIVDAGSMSLVPSARTGYPQQDAGNDTRAFEYRSMWCDGYDIVNISMVKKLVKFALDHNFNCISPLINGNYYGVYYNSTYLPKHKDVQWSFDPLMELIKEAHKYGIQVQPWFHTLYDYLATTRNPSWRVVSSSGYPASGWMNPSLPQVRGYLVNLTTEIVREYPLDGIKLDTARYPGSSYSYDPYTLAKFQSSGMSSFSDFRRLQVTECVGMIYDAIMKERPYIWVSADIWMVYSSWYDGVFQDSREWARRGKIDLVTTMSYTTSKTSFEYYNRDVIANSQGIPVVCGPYVFVPGNTAHGSVPNETVGIDLLINQTETAGRIGAIGTCMFSYKFFNQYHSYADALLKGPYSKRALCPLKEQRIPVAVGRWVFDDDHDREGWRVLDMPHQYPLNGVWSISNVTEPSLMTPLLNATSDGTNVVEISLTCESDEGVIRVFWSSEGTEFDDGRMVEVPIEQEGGWHLYSIHLDDSQNYSGPIRYLRIVPTFPSPTNLTLDDVKLYWMPDCVRECAYLGPFLSGSSEGLLERDYIGGEADAAPRVGDTCAGRTWERFGIKRDLVDLGSVMGCVPYSVVYVHLYIVTPAGGPHELRLGTSDGMKAFLNGAEVAFSSAPRHVGPDLNVTIVDLVKGSNRLLIKMAVYGKDVSYYARMTGPGNESHTDLSFLTELPVPEDPDPWTNFEYWTYSVPVWVKWNRSSDPIRTSFYEWRIDGGQISRTDTEHVFLSDLEDGVHLFEVRAVDVFGTRSGSGKMEFGVDLHGPEISCPVPGPVTPGFTSVRWTWSVLREPLSGIVGFHVQVEMREDGGDAWYPYRDKVFTESTEYILEGGLQDTRSYRLSVTAVSCNGLSSIQVSQDLVRVDMEPPTIPGDPILSLIDGADRSYILSWGPSTDNMRNGIGYYEVFREGNNGTYLIGRTPQNWFNISRELYSNDGLMVRAVDVSGLRSEMSGPVRIDNIPPVASIDASMDGGTGLPIHLTGERSYDPDGSVVEHSWYIDGRLARYGPDLFLTLNEGTYHLKLVVTDDLGTSTTLDLTLEPVDMADPSLGKSLRTFIDEGSVLHITVPVDVTIHKNMTIVEDPEVERPLLSRKVLTRTMITISSIMISLLALVWFVHSLTERKERKVDEPKDTDEGFVVHDTVPSADPAPFDVQRFVTDIGSCGRTDACGEPIGMEPFVEDVSMDDIMVLDELEGMEGPDMIEWDPFEEQEFEPLDDIEEVA